MPPKETQIQEAACSELVCEVDRYRLTLLHANCSFSNIDLRLQWARGSKSAIG